MNWISFSRKSLILNNFLLYINSTHGRTTGKIMKYWHNLLQVNLKDQKTCWGMPKLTLKTIINTFIGVLMPYSFGLLFCFFLFMLYIFSRNQFLLIMPFFCRLLDFLKAKLQLSSILLEGFSAQAYYVDASFFYLTDLTAVGFTECISCEILWGC